MQKSLRIGQILYTNVLPVYFYFDQERFEDRIEFIRQVPAQLNQAMARGEIDVGPISSFSYAEHASHYVALADLSVSAKGRVGSLFLFSKKPIEQLDGAKIALTNTSATTVNLLKIILHKFYGFELSYVTQEPELEQMLLDSDAALLIGDDAIQAVRNGGPLHVYDLGELWHQFTGYSMTFAVWAVRKEVLAKHSGLLADVHASFLASKEKTRHNTGPLIEYVHTHYGGDMQEWTRYFQGLQHDFGDEQRIGLEYYYRCAAELGLLPAPATVDLWQAGGRQTNTTLTR
ncbi:menaquinone biosynthesis protein [Brevibacillus choshinensis]|uniref:menaquinone biosynthetic enzyme MqnA/MqnD family protein n=1 Tax=Brevibacillus choshinensis TaxID=54911 RepID=UPI002E2473AF|nr:menaquinone biosynthesis protein [Brevibacillus choshinensis]